MTEELRGKLVSVLTEDMISDIHLMRSFRKNIKDDSPITENELLFVLSADYKADYDNRAMDAGLVSDYPEQEIREILEDAKII